MAEQDIREYDVRAQNMDRFGRVLCSARSHHFIVDGPVQNGCPGEAITPAEVFLSGVAACGVELLQVIARNTETPLKGVSVQVHGTMDRSKPTHPSYTLFQAVNVHFVLAGVSQEQAGQLIDSFRGR